MTDEETMRRAREFIEGVDRRPRQEFVAAVMVFVGLAIVVGIFLVFA
jgi:hypothetical protein